MQLSFESIRCVVIVGPVRVNVIGVWGGRIPGYNYKMSHSRSGRIQFTWIVKSQVTEE